MSQPVRMVVPGGVDVGQQVFLKTKHDLVAAEVEIAAGHSVRIAIPSVGVTGRWVSLDDLRVTKLLSPADQLKELGWNKVKTRSKRQWQRPKTWMDPLDFEPSRLTLSEACDAAGIALQ